MRQDLIDALNELRTICINKKNSNKFLSIESYMCRLNNGKTITREKILKNGKDGSAVIIYPITEDGKTIIAVEPSKPIACSVSGVIISPSFIINSCFIAPV